MKQEAVAIYTQNVYALDRGPTMDTARRAENRPRSQETQRPRQQANREQVVQFARREEVDREVRKGFAELQREQERERLSQTRQQVTPQARREPVDQPLPIAPPLPPEAYFPQVPPNLTYDAQEFCEEAEGKPLDFLETSFLTRHYVRLKRKTGSLASIFLSLIRNELLGRTVDITLLDHAAETLPQIQEERIRPERWQRPPIIAGAQDHDPELPLEGINNGDLQRILNRVNIWVRTIGRYNPRVLEQAQEEILRLHENVPQAEIETAARRIHTAQSLLEARARERELEKGGWYGQVGLEDADRELIKEDIGSLVNRAQRETLEGKDLKGDNIDRLFNRMFRKIDTSSKKPFETAFGNAGSIEHTEFMNVLYGEREDAKNDIDRVRADTQALNRARVRYDTIQRLIYKYDQEYDMREILHNAYYIAASEREFKDFAGFCANFASEYADLAFVGKPEVESAMRVREQVLYQIKRQNNGWIPHELVAIDPKSQNNQWERQTEVLMEEMNSKLLFGRRLNQWEMERALALSRGFGMVLLRYPGIVAECELPANPEQFQSQRSMPWERIAWELNPMDHLIKRFNMGREVMAAFSYNRARKAGWKPWNQDELKQTLAFHAVTGTVHLGEDSTRGVDRHNVFKIGGPLEHTGWRMYTSALQQDMRELRPLLDKDPGLATKLLFNHYRTGDLADYRDQFLRERADLPDDQLQKAWKEEKERYTKEHDIKTEWSSQDREDLQKAADRIPHVMLRIITDKSYQLASSEQKEAILREIFGNDYAPPGSPGYKRFQEIYTQIETDLTYAKENLMKRRRRAIDEGESGMSRFIRGTEETPPEDRLMDDDFEVIAGDDPTGERRNRMRRLHTVVKRVFAEEEDLVKRIIEKHQDRGFMFALTGEDVPWGEFAFIQTGGRGFITRKVNDSFQDKLATDEMIAMLKNIKDYTKPEQAYEQIRKVFANAEIHDYDRAQEAVMFLAEGVVRLFQKDGLTKIPIIGEIISAKNRFLRRGDSYAQTIWGRALAPAWDDDDIYNFLEMFKRILNDGSKIDELRKQVGATSIKALWARGKIGLYLAIALFLYEFTEKVVESK